MGNNTRKSGGEFIDKLTYKDMGVNLVHISSLVLYIVLFCFRKAGKVILYVNSIVLCHNPILLSRIYKCALPVYFHSILKKIVPNIFSVSIVILAIYMI